MLNKVLALLDHVIHEEMEFFKILGNKTRELTEKKVPHSKIVDVHKSMAQILKKLSTVESRVRFLYPEYKDLFTILIKEFHGPKS